MSESILAQPASVEQTAAAIGRMDEREKMYLLYLAPDLLQIAVRRAAKIEEMKKNVALLKKEVMAALNHQPLSSDEPFLNGLTLREYDALSEEEKDKLWDEVGGEDWVELEEEGDVKLNALPATRSG